MNLYEVSDYKLDPPDQHECGNENKCEYCHEFEHGKELSYAETYAWCELCQDQMNWDIQRGRRCCHLEEVSKRAEWQCEECTDFYGGLKI